MVRVRCEDGHVKYYQSALDVPMQCWRVKCHARVSVDSDWSEPEDTKSDKV